MIAPIVGAIVGEGEVEVINGWLDVVNLLDEGLVTTAVPELEIDTVDDCVPVYRGTRSKCSCLFSS